MEQKLNEFVYVEAGKFIAETGKMSEITSNQRFLSLLYTLQTEHQLLQELAAKSLDRQSKRDAVAPVFAGIWCATDKDEYMAKRLEKEAQRDLCVLNKMLKQAKPISALKLDAALSRQLQIISLFLAENSALKNAEKKP